MTVTLKMKLALLISGMIAATIGGLILTVPEVFYASYGIVVSGGPSELNETRASGGLLFAMGVFVVTGAFVPALTFTSGLVAILVYLSYGLSRLIGFALDGWPNEAVIEAAIIELAIGLVLCAVMFCDKMRSIWRQNQQWITGP